MHTDFALIAGTHHTAAAKSCQDFCLAETRGDRAWAVVADGCSTGGQTDLGARAWAGAARRLLRGLETIEVDAAVLRERLLQEVHPAVQLLDFADGYSTLGLLQVHGKRVHATFFGDGALLVRHRDGSTTLVNLQYTGGAPYYLHYLLRPEAVQQWQAEFGHQELLVVSNCYDAAGELQGLKTHVQPATQAWTWEAHVDAAELELVILTTDGVGSRTAGFIPTAKEMLAVKAPTGEFLCRRLARAARNWQQEKILPQDDLAVAGVWLGPESDCG